MLPYWFLLMFPVSGAAAALARVEEEKLISEYEEKVHWSGQLAVSVLPIPFVCKLSSL